MKVLGVIGAAGTLVAILVVALSAAQRVAVAEDGVSDNAAAILKISEATEKLTSIIEEQRVEKKAREETEARLCKSGAIDAVEWCRNQGYETPTR